MFNLHDLHWIAAILNPRTRMLKLATEIERNHAHGLVRSELAKILENDQVDENRSDQPAAISSPSSTSRKKFKSYTTQFDDDTNNNQMNNDLNNSLRARRELESYLQLDISKYTNSDDEYDNPLRFWKEQAPVLPTLSKLSRKIFCIPASSAAVERAFSSAGFIISQRRSNLNPSTVNDIMLVRSAGTYSKN